MAMDAQHSTYYFLRSFKEISELEVCYRPRYHYLSDHLDAERECPRSLQRNRDPH